MKGPAATRVVPRGLGMVWDETPTALDETELVAVRSNARPPSELHPESALAPARMPTHATVLSTFPVTRLLISPLVRRYSMDPRLGG